MPKTHYYLLDELRGLAIIFMVVYHAFFSLDEVFGSAAGQMLHKAMRPVQPFIAGTFILICGICCRFSHSNALRGLRIAGAAALVTLVTWLLSFFGMDLVITFGVLHLLAAAVLLFALLRRPLDKLPQRLVFLVFAALFLASIFPFYVGQPGFAVGSRTLHFPQTESFPLYALGFPSTVFDSSDYVPLIPWLFLFLAGTALGAYGEKGRFPAFFAKSRIPPLQWLGRRSLLMYLLHQPVLFGLFSVIFWVTGR